MDEGAEEEEEYGLEERKKKKFILQNQFIFGFSHSHYVIYRYNTSVLVERHLCCKYSVHHSNLLTYREQKII